MSNTGAGPSKVRPGSSQPSESSKRKRGMFQKDCELFSSGNSLFEILRSLVLVFDGLSVYLEGAVQHMMYGFGDDANPLPETVALVEDIVVEYVTDMVHKAQDTASKRGKLLTEDFLFLIRRDLPKLNRCTELLSMNEELKQARKAFEVDEEKLVSAD